MRAHLNMGKTYRYVPTKDGVRSVEIKRGHLESRKDFDYENNGNMSQKILNAYHQLECEQGSRFESGSYSPREIRHIHETAMARGEG